jgi:hypothetical protein
MNDRHHQYYMVSDDLTKESSLLTSAVYGVLYGYATLTIRRALASGRIASPSPTVGQATIAEILGRSTTTAIGQSLAWLEEHEYIHHEGWSIKYKTKRLQSRVHD